MSTTPATIINSICTYSSPDYINVEYLANSVDSTSFISLELLGLSNNQASYRVNPRVDLTGKSYALNLIGFSVSCESTSFDVFILNIDDETKKDTINEVLKYTSINKLKTDTFTEFIIINKDSIMTNNLYILFEDNSGSPGDLRINLIYKNIQDRL